MSRSRNFQFLTAPRASGCLPGPAIVNRPAQRAARRRAGHSLLSAVRFHNETGPLGPETTMKPPNIRATRAGCRVQRSPMVSPTNLVGQVRMIRAQARHRPVPYNRPVHTIGE